MADVELAKTADDLFKAFPMELRSTLRKSIIQDPTSPYRLDGDGYPDGRMFYYAISSDSDIAKNVPLSVILRGLDITDIARTELYKVFIRHMIRLNPSGGGAGVGGAGAAGNARSRRSKKNWSRRRSSRRPSTRRH